MLTVRNLCFQSRQPFSLSSILVTESFRDFCKSEILTGENLYDAGSIHGLQVCYKQRNVSSIFYCSIGSGERREVPKVSSCSLSSFITL